MVGLFFSMHCMHSQDEPWLGSVWCKRYTGCADSMVGGLQRQRGAGDRPEGPAGCKGGPAYGPGPYPGAGSGRGAPFWYTPLPNVVCAHVLCVHLRGREKNTCAHTHTEERERERECVCMYVCVCLFITFGFDGHSRHVFFGPILIAAVGRRFLPVIVRAETNCMLTYRL